MATVFVPRDTVHLQTVVYRLGLFTSMLNNKQYLNLFEFDQLRQLLHAYAENEYATTPQNAILHHQIGRLVWYMRCLYPTFHFFMNITYGAQESKNSTTGLPEIRV